MVPGDRHTPMAGSLPEESDDQVTLELSVVIPCLNEAGTIQHVIETAQRVIAEHHISAEIVVADNGSTDGSQATAASLGARVVPVTRRGYGSALMGGIALGPVLGGALIVMTGDYTWIGWITLGCIALTYVFVWLPLRTVHRAR